MRASVLTAKRRRPRFSNRFARSPRSSVCLARIRCRADAARVCETVLKSHKNDDRDAEAIAEAATRPNMRFVPVKSEEQLDVQTLHRARERLVGTRTALINRLHGVLFDSGIVIPKGAQS